jgi:hypothetical protein
MQEMRNCCNQYPGKKEIDKFIFQFKYKPTIEIFECPNSYFDDIIMSIYSQYSNYLVRKRLGIFTNAKDVSLLEMECYNIIESESNIAEEEKFDRDMKAAEKKGKKSSGRRN